MYKHILVPLDGSEIAEEALPSVVALSEKFGSKVTLLNVFEVIALLPSDRKLEFENLKRKGEDYLREVKANLEGRGISVETEVKDGDPSLVICQYAGDHDIDLVVMSAQSHGKVEKWALGSVSEKVLRRSPKPVLLLRWASRDLLRGAMILAVDDEPDVLDVIEEELDVCVVHKAMSYKEAMEHLRDYRYDLVILDIMGVDGFELLKHTVQRGIPTVMLTAHALSTESLVKSAKLGAVSFLPKEKISDLRDILTEVIQSSGRPVWRKLFDRVGPYFKMRFGWSSEEEEDILKEIQSMFQLHGK